ncbi:Protein transport protein S9 plasma membrane t-SNARE, partial [Linderina pennispora]
MSNYRGYNSGASGNDGGSYGNSGRAGGSYGSPNSAAGGSGGFRRYGAASSRYNASGGGSNDSYGDSSQQRQYDDSDEEVDFIKTKITKAKQDTLDSTRNALRTLQQTEDVGVKTLTKLGEQTEQLNRIDRTMEMTSLQAENSVEQTGKLRTLNKSIFHVHVKNPFSGKKRREAEMAKLEAEQERVRLAEERKLQNDHESRNRIGRFTNPNGLRAAGPPGRMTADGHTIVSDT